MINMVRTKDYELAPYFPDVYTGIRTMYQYLEND